MSNPRQAVKSGVDTLSGAAVAVRRRRPFVDHAIRAYRRYTDDGGDRLAASATYYAFLSFFPLTALVFSITGFVVDAYPDLQEELTDTINEYLPGLADKLDVGGIGGAKVGVGLLGLLGLLLTGLAWIDALRDAIRLMWHQSVVVGNVVVRRLKDIGVLAGLGLMLLASLVVTSLATSATGWFLSWVGLSGSTAAAWTTGALALGLALAIDLVVFLYLFWRLPQTTLKRRALRGALLGAVGVELLKIAGTWLVARTTTNPVYGTFAVIVGLLIWINIVMRWTLFVSAWTVTAPYSSDVAPSGTAEGSSPHESAAEGADAGAGAGAGAREDGDSDGGSASDGGVGGDDGDDRSKAEGPSDGGSADSGERGCGGASLAGTGAGPAAADVGPATAGPGTATGATAATTVGAG